MKSEQAGLSIRLHAMDITDSVIRIYNNKFQKSVFRKKFRSGHS